MSAGLIYQRVFCPEEIQQLATFHSNYTPSSTQLRIKADQDGQKELIFRLELINRADAANAFKPGDDITVEVRLGNALVPNKRDPLYAMISDADRAAIGFKISESGPIKGAEGIPEKYLDLTRLSGDDNETASLQRSDYPDEFHMTLKPNQYWGTIFCTQGNGTKQCVSYGKKPDFERNGVYFDLYRHDQIEEYIINYVEVKIYRGGVVAQ